MKALNTQKIRSSAIVMDLSDLEAEAGLILSRARAQAAKIVADARSQAEREDIQHREAARTAGYADGQREGLLEGRQAGHDEAVARIQEQLAALAARWSQTLELLHQHMPVHVADAKTDLLKLALAIAEKVTRQEALRNRQVAPALVEEALRMVGSARTVSVHVSPVEMEMLELYLPEIKAKFNAIQSVELVVDETVGAGGCSLRFGAGKIDAGIETQIARVAAELGVATPLEIK